MKEVFLRNNIDIDSQRQADISVSDSLIASWLSRGGRAGNGTVYGTPDKASAWGKIGCPLLPRALRESDNGSQEAPLFLKDLLMSPNLTNRDLDADVLRRSGLTKIPTEQIRTLREYINGISILPSQIAIPAGVPFAWLRELPFPTRAKNAINKLSVFKNSNDVLETPITCGDLLAIPYTGKMALIELLCVMESAETTEDDLDILEAAWLGQSLRDFARWAANETESITIGDAVARALERDGKVDEWRTLSEIELDGVAPVPEHLYEVLDSWRDELDDREESVFKFRLCLHEGGMTLQELGTKFNLTRERVRQIQKSLEGRLKSFADEPAGSPIGWRLETIRHHAGVAARLSDVQPFLASTEGRTDYQRLLLELAGPYKTAGEWLVLKSAVADDPTRSIFDSADEHSCINRESAATKLDDWGLDRSRHEDWLLKDNKLREINGHLVRWDVSVDDKLAFALFDIGKPATVDELIEHIGWDRSEYTPVNAMRADTRFVRVNQKQWGLASWENPVYSGIASSIRELLEAEGTPLRVAGVARSLSKKFDVREGSVWTYCYVPMFVVDDGWIKLRGIDEPYTYDPVSLSSTPGVFILDTGRVSLLIKVDSNVLRGAGRQLTFAAGSVLDVKVSDRLVFRNPGGLSVACTFPETSSAGPTLGSTRAFAENAGAKLGDYMTLVFDRSDMSVDARVTDVSLFEPSWELVARLTGIDACSGMDGLAEALDCNTSEVLTVLRERRDHAVAEAIPPLQN